MKKPKLIAFLAAALITASGLFYGFSYHDGLTAAGSAAAYQDCQKKGQPDCPYIKNCPKKGKADCPYKNGKANCCRKKKQ